MFSLRFISKDGFYTHQPTQGHFSYVVMNSTWDPNVLPKVVSGREFGGGICALLLWSNYGNRHDLGGIILELMQGDSVATQPSGGLSCVDSLCLNELLHTPTIPWPLWHTWLRLLSSSKMICSWLQHLARSPAFSFVIYRWCILHKKLRLCKSQQLQGLPWMVDQGKGEAIGHIWYNQFQILVFSPTNLEKLLKPLRVHMLSSVKW